MSAISPPTAIDPDALIPFVALEDKEMAGAAAFADPSQFDRVELQLVGELLSYRGVADSPQRSGSDHYAAWRARQSEGLMR